MKLPAYPRTKPSGVEWLGDMPEHSAVKRLKTSAICWVSNVDKVPAEDELPVRLCNYTDVYYNDHITPDMELMETTATADEIRRFGLESVRRSQSDGVSPTGSVRELLLASRCSL